MDGPIEDEGILLLTRQRHRIIRQPTRPIVIILSRHILRNIGNQKIDYVKDV